MHYYEGYTDFTPNLKGFMVGNGVTNWDYDCDVAYVEMAYWHGLYPTHMYRELHELNCNFSDVSTSDLSTECINWYAAFEALTTDINIYDLYGTCYHSNSEQYGEKKKP